MTLVYRSILVAALLWAAACNAAGRAESGVQLEALAKVGSGAGGAPAGDPCSIRAGADTCTPPAHCRPVACTQSVPMTCFGTCSLPTISAGADAPKPLLVCFSDDNCAADQHCSISDGVCNPAPCAPGRICAQVCTGFCVPDRPTGLE